MQGRLLHSIQCGAPAMISKPMLASVVTSEDLSKVEWPALASPKIDGIRVLIHPELGPVTRSFKTLPNVYTCESLKRIVGWTQLDGELIVTDDKGFALTFNETQSALMSRGGQPRFVFCVFDCFFHPEDPYERRYNDTKSLVEEIGNGQIRLVGHTPVASAESFANYASKCLEDGYEGACLRSLEGPYKSGRSTLRQGWLLKYKEWSDAEGIIIGFEERMHNANEDIKDHFGHAKRSSHKANMQPMGTLGALVLKTAWGELRVGTGFDDAQRQLIWNARTKAREENEIIPYLGRTVVFKYQSYGMQDKPRFPVFKGFRDNE